MWIRHTRTETCASVQNRDMFSVQDGDPGLVPRDVNEYSMIRMIGIPKEYGRYMHQYTYSMHIC